MTSTPADVDAWTMWRQARPARNVIHLDSAAAGCTPTAVLDAVAAFARREATDGAYVAAEGAAATTAGLRGDLAALLAVDADGIAFTESATTALAAALRVAPLQRGDVVAVASTEWGPNLTAFAAAGLTTRPLAVDGAGSIDPAALRRALADSPPAFVHVTHQASHRAVRHPLAAVAAVCRDAGVPLWVDVAQALGHGAVAVGADLAYGTSRKWLTGPRGVGFLAVAPSYREHVRLDGPTAPRPGFGPLDGLESHEAHVAGRIGLATAVAAVRAIGTAAIGARLDEVGRMTRGRLAEVPGWELTDAVDAPGAITAVAPTGGQDVFAVRSRLLDEHGILTTPCATVRAPLDMDRPLLRISPHVDVTADELDALAAALTELG